MNKFWYCDRPLTVRANRLQIKSDLNTLVNTADVGHKFCGYERFEHLPSRVNKLFNEVSMLASPLAVHNDQCSV